MPPNCPVRDGQRLRAGSEGPLEMKGGSNPPDVEALARWTPGTAAPSSALTYPLDVAFEAPHNVGFECASRGSTRSRNRALDVNP
eukprot:scaffold2065_cov359-Prasinococcus_capsulatus_cf.AAC.8